MKKLSYTILAILLTIIVGITTVIVFGNEKSNEKGKTVEVTPNSSQLDGLYLDFDLTTEKVNKNRLSNETKFEQYLHAMSHQKVKAEDKWDFMPLTKNNVETMLTILDHTNYKHEKKYRDILNEWRNDDFSNAVDAHNFVWKNQGGTVGKAYGLLTEEEEHHYIIEFFGQTYFNEHSDEIMQRIYGK